MKDYLLKLPANEDSRILRLQSHDSQNRRRQSQHQGGNNSRNNNGGSGGRYCCLCRTANRPGYESHFLAQCRFLPEADRRRISGASSRIRNVEIVDSIEDVDVEIDQYDEFEGHSRQDTNANNLFIDAPAVTRRVVTRKSPRMRCFFAHIPLSLCLDSGAESNLIFEKTVLLMGLTITSTTQGANQADMKTPLNVVGEVTAVEITKGSHVFTLDALVVRDELGDLFKHCLFLT